jgi:hypothetical protein
MIGSIVIANYYSAVESNNIFTMFLKLNAYARILLVLLVFLV